MGDSSREWAFQRIVKAQAKNDSLRAAATTPKTVVVTQDVAKRLVDAGFTYTMNDRGEYIFIEPQSGSAMQTFALAMQPPMVVDTAAMFNTDDLDADTRARLKGLLDRGQSLEYASALGLARLEAAAKRKAATDTTK